MVAPPASAVSRYSSTTRNALNVPGIAGPSCTARTARATSASVSGSRSVSAVTGCPGMKRVTRQPASARNAATGGATPTEAAVSVAIRSASRSMPSLSVSLPVTRRT